MAYSITTKDGITINNIPDDVSPDSPELKARVAAIRSGGVDKGEQETTISGIAGAATRGLAPIAAGAGLGAVLGAPIGGIGMVPGAVAGAGAGAIAEIAGDPIVSTINSLMGTNYTLPTQAMENLLTRIGVAEPKTEAERIVQATASGAAGAGGVASLGHALRAAGAASPVISGVGSQLAAQPLAQIAGGAGSGLAGQSAAESGAGPVGQVAASLAGGIAGAKLGGLTIKPTQLPSDLAEAKKLGVRLMTSDVIPPRTFASKWIQSVGERIPLAGTGGIRQEQQVQRIEAVRNVLRDFGADDAAKASDNVMADLASKRIADLTKYSNSKSEVINRLSSSGEVPMARTVQAIDDQIAKLNSLKTQEVTPVISRLEDWKASIQGQNLSNIETLRKQIGESFKSPELASIRGIGEKSLSSIYGPLKQDMEEFIKLNGNRRDVTQWKVADKRLANLAGELEMGTLKSVLKRGDATPEIINNMLFSKKPSEVRQLYSSLTPEGRANARSAILAKAAEKAQTEVAEGVVISPDKFANEVKRMGNSVGVFFTGDDVSQINGLMRVLNITKRAAEASAAPPTGVQQSIPIGAAALASYFGGGLEGFLGAIGTAGGIGGMARIYESAPVRNALIKVSQTIQNSPEEAAAIKRLIAVTNQNEIEKK